MSIINFFDSKKHVKERKYKTFEDYISVTGYDNEFDYVEYCESIPKFDEFYLKVKYFLNYCESYYNKISLNLNENIKPSIIDIINNDLLIFEDIASFKKYFNEYIFSTLFDLENITDIDTDESDFEKAIKAFKDIDGIVKNCDRTYADIKVELNNDKTFNIKTYSFDEHLDSIEYPLRNYMLAYLDEKTYSNLKKVSTSKFFNIVSLEENQNIEIQKLYFDEDNAYYKIRFNIKKKNFDKTLANIEKIKKKKEIEQEEEFKTCQSNNKFLDNVNLDGMSPILDDDIPF